MNVISALPKWAQAPTQKWADKQPLEGTQKGPLTQDTFDSATEAAVGIINMAAMDEVEGEDLAMGQPGVVSPQAGVKLTFEGDVSSASSTFKGVVDVPDQNATMYLKSSPSGIDVLTLVQTEGGIGVSGAVIQQAAGGFGGFIVAGETV